jgi:DNA polymerase-2
MKDIINLIKECVESENDSKYLDFMRKFYNSVKDEKILKKNNNNIIYKGKEQYYQWVKKEIYELIKNYNINPICIYGDTDSLFVKLKEGSETKICEKLALDLNFYLNRIIADQFKVDSHLEVEFEKLYSNLFFSAVRGSDVGAKKRYVGESQGQLEFVGMEYVRSDWTLFAKKFQFKLYEKIFQGDNVELFIKDTIKNLESGSYDKEIIYNKRFSKPIEEYTKTSPPHVKAARLLSSDKQKGLREIEYIMCMNGPRPVDLISDSDKIDYSHYIDKQLGPIADSVLRFLDLDFESIACGDQLSFF